MRLRDIIYTLAVLIVGTAVSSAQFLINPYAFAAGGGGGDTAFITGVTLGSKTSQTVQLGMKITIGASPITVTEVGIYGNNTKFSPTMDVYIRSSGGADLGHATVTWGAASQFYYATLSSPVVLSASTVYYVMTDALGFNDIYTSATTTVTTTAAATTNDAAYGQPPTGEGSAAGKVYGPLDFKYH